MTEEEERHALQPPADNSDYSRAANARTLLTATSGLPTEGRTGIRWTIDLFTAVFSAGDGGNRLLEISVMGGDSEVPGQVRCLGAVLNKEPLRQRTNSPQQRTE